MCVHLVSFVLGFRAWPQNSWSLEMFAGFNLVRYLCDRSMFVETVEGCEVVCFAEVCWLPKNHRQNTFVRRGQI